MRPSRLPNEYLPTICRTAQMLLALAALALPFWSKWPFAAPAHRCWPSSRPVGPTAVPPSAKMDGTRYTGEFGGRVDVLQVVRVVDCVVAANVLLVHQHRRAKDFLHVIVTPDTQRCAILAQKWRHVRCCSDASVLSNVTLDGVAQLLAAVGPQAAAKGAPWYWQQMLKLGAVAHGVQGLGTHVRIMDGETLMVQPADWFTGSGAENFDTCDPKGRDHRHIGDGWNHERYGALPSQPIVMRSAWRAHTPHGPDMHMHTRPSNTPKRP